MIGGNLTAIIQTKTSTINEIGEAELVWTDKYTIKGWLDLASGNSHYSHNVKSEDSTHTFLMDYDSIIRGLDITQCRLNLNNRIYEIKFIDDPMEIHDHLEISLSLLGVANV